MIKGYIVSKGEKIYMAAKIQENQPTVTLLGLRLNRAISVG